MKKVNVLLIGGTGTLSYAVLMEALEKGFQMTLFNRGKENLFLPKEVNVVIGDFYDNNSLKNIADCNYDIVVDFLSRKPSDIKRVYPIFMNKCKQYIFISSACVYKRSKNDFPINEKSDKPNTNWSYNIEKYNSELKLIELSGKSTSFYTIVRPYITYNEQRIPLGIVPAYKYHRTIIERFKADKSWFVWNNGNSISTLTYVSEFAIGVVGLFLNPQAYNEDFHITSDYFYTQNEIIEILSRKLNVKPNVVNFSVDELSNYFPMYREMLEGDRALDAVFDNSKIKSVVPDLNFNISLDKGLDYVITYWSNLKEYKYDYMFEALLDKALKRKGINSTFISYQNSRFVDKIIYFSYRYLSIKIARKILKIILK